MVPISAFSENADHPLLKFVAVADPDRKDENFADFKMFVSYVTAIRPEMTPERISQLASDLVFHEDTVVGQFGEIPASDGAGNPVVMNDFLVSVINRAPQPTYSPAQMEAYRKYRRAR